MLSEPRLSIPLNSQLPPNPNPNPHPHPSPPQTNDSHMTISHGFGELQSSAEITTHPQTNGITSEATQAPTVAHLAGNLGAVVQPAAYEVMLPMQPVNPLPFMCEVCKITCDTRYVLEKHKLGKKHVKNTKKLATSSSIAPELAPQQASVIASSSSIAPEMAPQQAPVVASSFPTAPEMTPQQAPVVASLSSMVAPEMAPQQPPVVTSSSMIAPEMAPQQAPVANSASMTVPKIAPKQPPVVASPSSMIAPEMALQQAPVTNSTSINVPEMAPNQPHVVASSFLKIAQEMAPQQAPVVANSASMTVPEMAPKQPPVVASPSPLIAQEMAPQQPPVVGSEPSVEELENKKIKLLQNGASVNTLLYCYICKVVCNNQEVYQSHVAGKKHTAKAARMQAQPTNDDGSQKQPDTLFWCELCKISCTGEELLKLHLAGRKHLKKVKRSETMEYLENLEKTIEPNSTVATEPEPNGKRAACNEDVKIKKQKVVQGGGVSDAASTTCTMCNVACTSPTDFRAHLSGKKHAAVAAKQAEAPTTGQAE